MNKLLIICTCLAVAVMSITEASAQDYESLRTKTWSVYGQGGVSWATGLDFKNDSPSEGTTIAPEVGAGVNYNLRPWIRFGLNYEFSKYEREQRFSTLQPVGATLDMSTIGMNQLLENNGGIAYRELWNTYHNVDLTIEFNVMEIWKNRKSNKFNLYAGAGIGMMFGRGNTYSIGMGYERWGDPDNNQGGLQVSDNWASQAWVMATNDRHNFNALYVPVVLSAEYDVTPRLTLGVKGQYKALISPDDLEPEGLIAAAVMVRYNFVGAKALTYKQKYEESLGKYNDLQAQYNASVDRARQAELKCENSLESLNAENKALKQRFDECTSALEGSKNKAVVDYLNIQFKLNDAVVSKEDEARLVALANEMKGENNTFIDLVGEASADGQPSVNQKLSEKRLANVMSILNKNGISSDRIKSAKAIGDANKVFNASNRKVEITINN